ncbi:hypothetical protein [Bosea thiooxidans]|uniref:hypothetical protein n=1 Tax=Bosea thiooxidans TaxID=53254 RepID=UPI0015926F76|nr:hypothetical protein [Bosea thiooxidans]
MSGKRKIARSIVPARVAEIAYRAWADDRKSRHAAFKGRREEADEASVFRIA